MSLKMLGRHGARVIFTTINRGRKMHRRNHRVCVAVAAALAGSLTGVASADQPAAEASDSADQLTTVVVTATKRTTAAQDTPISMTVLTASDIADRGLTDFNTLAQGVRDRAQRPSVPKQPVYEMGGLNAAGGNTSMVGVYLDEIA